MFCLFVIFCCNQDLSCVWHVTKTQDLYRSGRTCLFYSSSLVIHHGTDFTGACAGGNEVTYTQGSFLYQDRGNRASSFVKLCLDHETSCHSLRIGFQL